jgi:hypothetical protein
MREPQLVRRPRVQKMSLWAMGMPVSRACRRRAALHRRRGAGQRRLAIDGDKAVQRAVQGLDARQGRLRQCLAAGLALQGKRRRQSAPTSGCPCG